MRDKLATGKVVPLVVACAYFMENFDGTVISTALPSIAHSFGSSAPATSVGITAYMFAVAIFIPISGWLSDRFGSRTVFCGAIGLFTLASLLCGMSSTLPEFIAARALQGLGGAMMLPVGRLIVLRASSRAEFVRAMSLVTMPGVAGQVLGPPLGGFFSGYLTWHWIFFINLPIGLIGMVLVMLLIDNIRGEQAEPFDWMGACLVGAAVACLIFSLSLLSSSAALSAPISLLAGGLILGMLALRYMREREHAILDLRLLATPTFSRGAAGGFLFRMAAAAIGLVIPLQLQIGFGMPPLTAGLLVFCSALGAFVMKGSAPPILRHFGFRSVLLRNGLLCMASILVCVPFQKSTPILVISIVLLAGGFFRSLQFAALNTVIYADVEPPKMSAATSFASMVQPLASAAGIAASALLLRVLAQQGPQLAGLSLSGLRLTLVAIGGLTLCGVLPFWHLARTAGDELSGRRRAGPIVKAK